ncbi:putative Mannose-P-dolichol utilization defect 1 protein [Glarea lozoyensis 74030]|uniref:Solute carrier family 66 member 3 n=1 Tax=Glarea lozoyensis (strain ATCC 74030 / MF5533) TaxID=1104152 RepID=H0EZE9_GLAL7|nr:putative Mannose-P-dolichol utilization defect 1 protein [Glarea lozoyensis 74030]
MDTLRSALQPLTTNLPTPIRNLGISLIGETCYQTLLLDIDLTNQACLKLAVSKGLGIAIKRRRSGKATGGAVFVAGLAAAAYALFSPNVVDMPTLGYFQAGAGVLGVASKLPQILAVWREGGTGQLSAFAVFNYLLGSLSRIFTTLQEVDDKLILYGFVAGFILNAVLAAQMAYYWNAPEKKSVKGSGKAKVALPASTAGSSTATPKGKSPTTRRRG